MSREKVSALLSLIAAIVVLGASYFQWWAITWDGKMVTRPWVRVLLAVVIALLIAGRSPAGHSALNRRPQALR